jgi:hypothetical protein
MKHPFALCIGLLLPLLHVTAQSAGEAEPAKIYTEAPIFDFGERPISEKVTHTFTLVNRGGSLLKIHSVKPSCGCTVANISSQELMPGDSATITTALDLQGRAGSVSKHITVNSNDPMQPALTLTLKGTGVASISVTPEILNFMAFPPNAPPTRSFLVQSKNGQTFDIKGVQSAGNLVSTEVVTKQAGLEYEIKVTPIIKADTAPGSQRDLLTITTTDPQAGTLRVTAVWQIQAPFMISPSVINLVATENAPAIQRHLMVRANLETEKPLVVTKAEWPGRDDIKILLTEAGSYGWRVELRGISPVPEMNGEKVMIYTNLPGYETNAIPVKVISQADVKKMPFPASPKP